MTTDERLVRQASGSLHAGFDPASGALAVLTSADGSWPILDRGGPGAAFRLLLPLPDRRLNYVDSADQPPPRLTTPGGSGPPGTIVLEWDGVRSQHGGTHDIRVTVTVTPRDRGLTFSIEVDNRSDLVVENVHFPCLGEVRPPSPSGVLSAFAPSPGGATRTELWPRFPNAAGFCSVERPTFFTVRNNLLGAVGAPVTPFVLLQGGDHGLYVGVDEPSSELVVWHAELHPGWGDSMDSHVLVAPDAGDDVRISVDAVHVPYVLPGERRRLTDIGVECYRGDWHTGADAYTRRRAEWGLSSPPPLPRWAASPHSWQQLQLNSAEDSLRLRFSDLPDVARECVERGITALQVVGWNDGGQDRNNPSHDPDPRLGTVDELRRAIAECRRLGVRVVLFTKFVWADRATPRFRDDLHRLSVKDPYGDYYVFPGFRYDTVTQLLDINTRRLVPMCFQSDEWLDLCAAEFATVAGLGADGMLNDEALHHSPALLCFATDHGHRLGAPVYARDRELVTRFRALPSAPGGDYLYAAEACYDWLFESYSLSYQRSNESAHLPLTRYLRPEVEIMTAITGYDDRNMLNQCLLYRYLASYEPGLFKGRLPGFERTTDYGLLMDTLRTELREWLWDGTFRDTVGATVHGRDGRSHHPYAVFRSAVDGSPALVMANYDSTSIEVFAAVEGLDLAQCHYRLVDDATWHPAGGTITLPPRSAAVLVPSRATGKGSRVH